MENGTHAVDTSGMEGKPVFVASDSIIKAIKPPTGSGAKETFSLQATDKVHNKKHLIFPLKFRY